MIYEIIALKDETRLKIFGVIGQTADGEGFMLSDFLQATEGLTRGTLIIEMNSPGGNPHEAFAIHDAIKQLPVKVIGRIMGMAASACTIIAAACDEREIAENGSYMVHNASTFAAGKKEELGKAFDELDKIDNRMLNIYVKQTGKSKKALQELMKQDRTMTPEEALQWGFVNKIIYNDNKKVIAMATEEKKEKEEGGDLESLRSENKALKAKLETLIAKLKSYEEEKEKDKDAKIKAAVTEAIKAGKIKADSADHFVSFGKHDFNAMTATIAGIEVKYEPIESVPNPKKSGTAATISAAWEAYKKGEIKTHTEYLETIKNLEG